jgi:TolB protein
MSHVRRPYAVVRLIVVAAMLMGSCTGPDAPDGGGIPDDRRDSPDPSAVEGDRGQSPSPSSAIGSGDSLPPFPPVACGGRSTRISFISERDGTHDIYALDIRHPDDVRRITELPGIVQDQAWSPDGHRFAFRWFRPATERVSVYVAYWDGSSPRLVVDQAATPEWSPDGTELAFANLRPGKRGIWVVNVAEALAPSHPTVHRVTRTEDTTPEEYPTWSPDGKRLLFSSLRGGTFDIWVVDADGSHLRDMTPQPSLEYSATWSPDGSEIVFGSDRTAETEGGGDIFAVDVETRKIRQLTADHGGNYAPAWSPDGRWIAFNSNRDGNTEIYIMRPDGTDQRRLTTAPQDDVFAVWVGDCGGRSK